MDQKLKSILCLSTAFTGTMCTQNSIIQESKVSEQESSNSPNIIYIVIDDMGFSDLGSYGSEIKTPNIDKLAANGLRYNNFHVTPMSSPTRAALLTGRNSHSVGMGRLANYTLDVPHSMAEITEEAATTPEILKVNGYNTFALGKWHLTPPWEVSAAGPFNNWPLGKGFEKFYGFMDGETDQYAPELIEGNDYLSISYPKDYHLTEDITDKATSYIQSQKSIDKNKPFMLYFATGAQHSPHQVPQKYIDRYEGVYNVGWDKIRDQRFEKQKSLNLIPQDTLLAPLNKGVKKWDDLDKDVKELFIEYQKTYAGFLEHTDEQIGRLINNLEEMGELDNTLIFLISDNGPSPSGKETGTLNTVNIKNGIPSNLKKDVLEVDNFQQLSPNYPTGWSQVSSTPFSYYKESAQYLGGIRVPLIIHYPNGIEENSRGQIRNQFSFVTDIAQTVYDIIGITMPKTVNGIEQIKLHGYSLKDSFSDPNNSTGRTTQYFELYGNRGLYHNNYFLSSRHTKGDDFANDTWTLYDLNTDFSQQVDIASENPQKLKEMLKIWDQEAKKYGVLPLDDKKHVELIATQLMKDLKKYTNANTLYPNTSSINANRSAYFTALNRSHTMRAFIDRKTTNEEGVLLAFGNHYGGYTFYIMNNKLYYDYNFDRTITTVESDIVVPTGEIQLVMDYKKTSPNSGSVVLKINEDPVGQVEIPQVYPFVVNNTDAMSIGIDSQGNVSPAYKNKGLFKYTGNLKKIDFVSQDDFNKLGKKNNKKIINN